MTRANTALLPDRGVVRVSGPDAEKLLQGIITNDMDLLAGQRAMHTALLTPQGKLLFEFFVARDGAGFVLETARDQADALVKRLSMYKLRARADIRDASAEHGVIAAWGPPPQSTDEHAVSFPDPRLPDLGVRMLVASKIASLANPTDGTADDYHAHRISLGVPEAGKDYALGDTFPHEANFDLLHGVSFSKGCFVGQEVVSRMQHRGTARKRIVIVEAAEPLRSGSEIAAGSAILGTVGSVAGRRGLALVRLDRVEEAQAKGQGLAAAGAEVVVRLPGYMKAAAAADAP